MWQFINVIMLMLALSVVFMCLKGTFRKNGILGSFEFIGITFILNFLACCVPYIYERVELGAGGMAIYDLWECMTAAIKHFVGDVPTDSVRNYGALFPLFTLVFSLSAILAMTAMVSTAFMLFKIRIYNYIRLRRTLSQPKCDIVVGESPEALIYARNNENTILMPCTDSDKDSEKEFMESGYTVLVRNFTHSLLDSGLFNSTTVYNFIFIEQSEKNIDHINTFISYLNSVGGKDNFYMYVETDDSSIEIIRREVLEKHIHRRHINLFSRNELMARKLTETYPVTGWLPKDFFDEDTSVKPDKKINIIMAGFNDLSKEIYRHFILNNQFVTYADNEYKTFAPDYYVFDEKVQSDVFGLGRIKNNLEKLKETEEEYFPIPDMPCNTEFVAGNPLEYCNLDKMAEIIKSDNAFTCVVIDIGNMYRNIELMSKLRFLAEDNENYKLIIRCESAVMDGINDCVCYGAPESIFTHGVIVDESLSAIARKINEVYFKITANVTDDDSKGLEEIREKAADSWNTSDYFDIYSNIYSALNLRFKLQLLGLDYVPDGKGENTELVCKKYSRETSYSGIDEYHTKNQRNAMLAQEHIRWNAYHLLSGWVPLKKSDITEKETSLENPAYSLKNVARKKHACLTTYTGLVEIAEHLAKKASSVGEKDYCAMDYDFCINDEMLIASAGEILRETGFSVVEK